MERPYRHILVSRDADLGVVTMNRPERRKALSEAHLRELTDALRSLPDREDVRAIVLAAAGPVYSSGHDFADMAERGLDGMRTLFAVCEEFMLTIQRVPQPMVAQVQGIATAAAYGIRAPERIDPFRAPRMEIRMMAESTDAPRGPRVPSCRRWTCVPGRSSPGRTIAIMSPRHRSSAPRWAAF